MCRSRPALRNMHALDETPPAPPHAWGVRAASPLQIMRLHPKVANNQPHMHIHTRTQRQASQQNAASQPTAAGRNSQATQRAPGVIGRGQSGSSRPGKAANLSTSDGQVSQRKATHTGAVQASAPCLARHAHAAQRVTHAPHRSLLSAIALTPCSRSGAASWPPCARVPPFFWQQPLATLLACWMGLPELTIRTHALRNGTANPPALPTTH